MINQEARKALKILPVRHRLIHKLEVTVTHSFADGGVLRICYVPRRELLERDSIKQWLEKYREDKRPAAERVLAWIEDLNNELIPRRVTLEFAEGDGTLYRVSDQQPDPRNLP